MGVVQSTSSVDFFGMEMVGDWFVILQDAADTGSVGEFLAVVVRGRV